MEKETFIRDSEGQLCRVLFKTNSTYQVERVKDRSRMTVPVNSVTIVPAPEPFPGDWAIKTA